MRKIKAALVVLLAFIAGSSAFAQDYPSKTIRWIVPYPAGGGADNIARLLTQRISEQLKQTIVVENRAGGNTIIATQALLAAAKDGYTVMQTAEQIASNSSLYPDLKYSAERDVEFISQFARVPFILLARPHLPAADAASLIAYIKANGDKVNFGSWGQGGANHLVMEAFAERIGTRLTHVPFQGAAPAIQNLLGGQIDLYFSDPTVALPFIRSGRLKPLLVSTRERLPYLPDVPTVHETGYSNFDMYTWHGLVAPNGIPDAAVRALSTAINKVLNEPAVRNELLERGLIADPKSADEFRDTFMKTQTSLGNVVRRLNIRIH
jgi:tripartite-type tricarboxylate transporter receptor subunit TctC